MTGFSWFKLLLSLPFVKHLFSGRFNLLSLKHTGHEKKSLPYWVIFECTGRHMGRDWWNQLMDTSFTLCHWINFNYKKTVVDSGKGCGVEGKNRHRFLDYMILSCISWCFYLQFLFYSKSILIVYNKKEFYLEFW